MKTKEFIEAKTNAVKYIMYKPRTQYEVKNKLLKLEYDEELIEEVINELLLLEYLNDNLYAEKFIRNSQSIKPMSKNMIKYKLREKGIADDIIQNALRETDIDEIELAKNLFLKQTKGKTLDEKELNKVKGFLARKGFSLAIINKVVKE